MIEFWKNYIDEISNTRINYSNYKCEDVITSLPLYSVDVIEEYEEYIKYVDQNFDYFEEVIKQSRFVDSFVFNKTQWIYSMYPDIRGFAYYPQLFFESIRRKINDLETSLPNITSAHHFFKYLELTGKSPLNYRRVVELGGGLGDLGLFFRNMGYIGNYIIYDLPEINKLQTLATDKYGLIITDQIPEYQEDTLFISTWGFSECPLELREKVMSTLKPENWLMIYQRKFQDLDNEEYFADWEGVRYDMSYVDFDGGSEMICK